MKILSPIQVSNTKVLYTWPHGTCSPWPSLDSNLSGYLIWPLFSYSLICLLFSKYLFIAPESQCNKCLIYIVKQHVHSLFSRNFKLGVQAGKCWKVTYKTRTKGADLSCIPFSLGYKPLSNLSCLHTTIQSALLYPESHWIHSLTSSKPAYYYTLAESSTFKSKFWLSTPIFHNYLITKNTSP